MHGAEAQVSALQPIIEKRFRIRCSAPQVLETVVVGVEAVNEVFVSPELLQDARPLLRSFVYCYRFKRAESQRITTKAFSMKLCRSSIFAGARGFGKHHTHRF